LAGRSAWLGRRVKVSFWVLWGQMAKSVLPLCWTVDFWVTPRSFFGPRPGQENQAKGVL